MHMHECEHFVLGMKIILKVDIKCLIWYSMTVYKILLFFWPDINCKENIKKMDEFSRGNLIMLFHQFMTLHCNSNNNIILEFHLVC